MNCDSHNSYHFRRAVVNFFKCCRSAALERNLFKCKLKKQFISQRQSTPAQLLQMQICIEVVYDLCPMFSKEALNSHICMQLLLQRPNYLRFFWVIYEKFRILDTMCRSLKEEKKLITCNSSAYFCDFSHFDNLKKVPGSVSFQMIAVFELHFRCIFAHWPSNFGREISIYLNE